MSYLHLSGLLAHCGEEPNVQIIGPLAVDGLMIMATGALLAGKKVARILDLPGTITPEQGAAALEQGRGRR